MSGKVIYSNCSIVLISIITTAIIGNIIATNTNSTDIEEIYELRVQDT